MKKREISTVLYGRDRFQQAYVEKSIDTAV